MKEPRDSSYGAGLDVVVTLPFNVVQQIKAAAKERGETVEGWCRAELLAPVEGEAPTEVAPGELMLDVHAALEKDPVTRDMDPLARRGFAHRIGAHLVQAGLLFRRKAIEPLPSESFEALRARMRAQVEQKLREHEKASDECIRAVLDAATDEERHAAADRLADVDWERLAKGVELSPADLEAVAELDLRGALNRGFEEMERRAREPDPDR